MLIIQWAISNHLQLKIINWKIGQNPKCVKVKCGLHFILTLLKTRGNEFCEKFRTDKIKQLAVGMGKNLDIREHSDICFNLF